jgi:hypothetical protein
MTPDGNICLGTCNCEDMSWDSLVDKYIIGIVQLTPIPCFNCLYTENIKFQPAVELTSLVPVLKFFVGLMYQNHTLILIAHAT